MNKYKVKTFKPFTILPSTCPNEQRHHLMGRYIYLSASVHFETAWAEEDKADKGRGVKTTSGNGQA